MVKAYLLLTADVRVKDIQDLPRFSYLNCDIRAHSYEDATPSRIVLEIASESFSSFEKLLTFLRENGPGIVDLYAGMMGLVVPTTLLLDSIEDEPKRLRLTLVFRGKRLEDFKPSGEVKKLWEYLLKGIDDKDRHNVLWYCAQAARTSSQELQFLSYWSAFEIVYKKIGKHEGSDRAWIETLLKLLEKGLIRVGEARLLWERYKKLKGVHDDLHWKGKPFATSEHARKLQEEGEEPIKVIRDFLLELLRYWDELNRAGGKVL